MRYLLAILLFFSIFSVEGQTLDSLKVSMKNSFKNENFELCISYANQILDTAVKNKDTANIINAYYYLGYASQKIGDMNDGMKYSTLCYELASAIDDKEIVSSALNNIGNIYMVNKQDSVALVYFNKSLEIERELGRKQNQATRLGNISSAYIKLGELDKALESAKQGLELDLEIGRKDKIAIRYNQLGNVYLFMKKPNEALDCQNNAFEYFKKAGSNYGMAITSHAIGDIYDQMYDYPSCKHYYLQALEYAQKINNRLLIEKIYKSLYGFSRDFEPAFSLKYYELYTALKDSIFDAENRQLLQDFQVKYESKKKELEIERQNTAIRETKAEFRVTMILIILLTIIIILLIIYIKSVKNKQHILSNINEIKDRMLSIISHDLKNPAIAERNVLYQLKKNYKNLPDEEIDKILDTVINSSETQIGLLNNLLEWTQLQIGKTEFALINFDLTSCIKDIIALFYNQLSMKNISISFDDKEKKMAFSDINIISTVVRNLISNAIKYSHEGGNIEITITDYSPEKYKVAVTDHGIGMPQSIIENLRSEYKVSTRPGTSGEPGNGIGLGICKRLLLLIKEAPEIESETGKGSTFSFTLNKKQK